MDDMYREVILDHYKNPRGHGVLEDADAEAEGKNPLCGDEVTIYVAFGEDGETIDEVKFAGRGCAISTAAASLMTEVLKGKTVAEAKALFERFHALVTGKAANGADDGLDELAALSGVKDFPTRIKCATLPWHTLTAAIAGSQEPVKTE